MGFVLERHRVRASNGRCAIVIRFITLRGDEIFIRSLFASAGSENYYNHFLIS